MPVKHEFYSKKTQSMQFWNMSESWSESAQIIEFRRNFKKNYSNFLSQMIA